MGRMELQCQQCCLCRHAGNLLVLQDQQGRPSGQVGFIDFGIVGRVTPVTWTALEALLTAIATRDFDTMARALATVGATDTDVDLKVFRGSVHGLPGSAGQHDLTSTRAYAADRAQLWASRCSRLCAWAA